MRIKDNIENEIVEYYKNKKKKEQLEYEIGLLEKSNEDLIKYSCIENKEYIDKRIERNKSKLIRKNIEKDEMINKILSMDSIIAQLSQEEKELCELRYKKKMEYQSIAYDLNVSRSTICRRVQALVCCLKKEYEKMSM